MTDTDAIAALIVANHTLHPTTVREQRLIDALADQFEAEGYPCDCNGKRTQWPCFAACESNRPFDKADFIRKATGQEAPNG